jgi:hypothetical protein
MDTDSDKDNYKNNDGDENNNSVVYLYVLTE